MQKTISEKLRDNIEKMGNFTFLKDKLPEFKLVADFAEQYVHTDPATACVKMRFFGEKLVKFIYTKFNWGRDAHESFKDLLVNYQFESNMPEKVVDGLHILRKIGNYAAHTQAVTTEDAIDNLKIGYELGKWMLATFENANIDDIRPFVIPEKPENIEQIKSDLDSLKHNLEKQENEFQEILEELQKARAEKEQIEQDYEELKAKAAANTNVLTFSEAETRKKLIDRQLTYAGWNVGENGTNTNEITQEELVTGQPTKSGNGAVDYVLWGEDGKPLALIEAKRTTKDSKTGRNQAKYYADALEEKYGKRPVIFCTNGYEIFIWNDKTGEPYRKIYGFYSKEHLEYLHFQNEHKTPPTNLKPNDQIADRLYQLEMIKRVLHTFKNNHRKALVTMATGTGKTRVAISIVDLLIRAKYVKRVLFLCDRKELRKQAKNAFNEFLPDQSVVILDRENAVDKNNRIYLSTYHTMINLYPEFNVGYFDLIIADESHRSIYNKFREIFVYFDALQIGLTATPVDYIERNTYRLFGCESKLPTAHYSLEEATESEPPYLVPFEVFTRTTEFRREGIKYSNLTKDQQLELEEQLANAVEFESEASELDKYIFNKDTARDIFNSLMEYGIKVKDGSVIGKTIIFARNHKHALFLEEIFNEMFPQYGSDFCQVIDNYNPRASELITKFKGRANTNELTIAISVDMLDTGIDVPEIVNLVFAKPVKSFVKFWQMIGRGTRLRPNLFGKGRDKEKFIIFDHFGNFEWFDEKYKHTEPSRSISLAEKLFTTRIDIAEIAKDAFNDIIFEPMIELIYQDLNDLKNTNTVMLNDYQMDLERLTQMELLKNFNDRTLQLLRNVIAAQMKWRNITEFQYAYKFDYLIARLQLAKLQTSDAYQNLKGLLQNKVNALKLNLSPVKAKIDIIKKVLSPEFWDTCTVIDLEEIRIELRGIMKYVEVDIIEIDPTIVLDVHEAKEKIEHKIYRPKLSPLDLPKYKEKVKKALLLLMADNPVIMKIKDGKPVSQSEIDSLVALILTNNPELKIEYIEQIYPESAKDLGKVFRKLIHVDPEKVEQRFSRLIINHPELEPDQIQFISQIKNIISKFGGIKPERLYETPFTQYDPHGLDGMFNDEVADEIVDLVKTFNQ